MPGIGLVSQVVVEVLSKGTPQVGLGYASQVVAEVVSKGVTQVGFGYASQVVLEVLSDGTPPVGIGYASQVVAEVLSEGIPQVGIGYASQIVFEVLSKGVPLGGMGYLSQAISEVLSETTGYRKKKNTPGVYVCVEEVWKQANSGYDPNYAITTFYASGTVTDEDELLVGVSADPITMTLPPATGNGKPYLIKNIGAGTITVTPDGEDEIDYESSISVAYLESKLIVDYRRGLWLVLSALT